MATQTLLLVAATLSLLAGCTNDYGVGAKVNIEYSGSQGGVHSETGGCDDSAKVNGSGTITDGEVQLRVLDGQGTEKFQRVFNANFKLDDESLSGISGDWKLEATRSSNDLLGGDQFNGNYHFSLFC